LEEHDQLRDLTREKLRSEIQQGINSGEATPLDTDGIKSTAHAFSYILTMPTTRRSL